MAPNVDDLIKASRAAAGKSQAAIDAAKAAAATVAATRPAKPANLPTGEQQAGTPAGGQR
jgi:hypothetical protein